MLLAFSIARLIQWKLTMRLWRFDLGDLFCLGLITHQSSVVECDWHNFGNQSNCFTHKRQWKILIL